MKCKQCKGKVVSTPGCRPKEYCSVKCKKAYNYKVAKKKKGLVKPVVEVKYNHISEAMADTSMPVTIGTITMKDIDELIELMDKAKPKPKWEIKHVIPRLPELDNEPFNLKDFL